MAANLRDPGSIPGGDPKRFQDSSNYVFYIVGECFSSAADTHLATDLTCKVLFYPPRTAPELPVTTGVGLGFWVVPLATCSKQSIPASSVAKGSLEQLSEI